jgi:hypothetical protein
VAKILIKEMNHPTYCPDLAPNDSGCFQKIKSPLKGRSFQDNEEIAKSDNGTEIYSTTGVQIFLQQ